MERVTETTHLGMGKGTKQTHLEMGRGTQIIHLGMGRVIETAHLGQTVSLAMGQTVSLVTGVESETTACQTPDKLYPHRQQLSPRQRDRCCEFIPIFGAANEPG